MNYLAPFLLTHLVLPCLRQASPARLLNVGSVGQAPLDFSDVMLERHYDPAHAYCQSKLALVMLTFDLAEELKGEHITVNCLHPATFMNTKMVSESVGYTLSTVQEGLRAVLYLATSPALDHVTGQYFDQQRSARAHPQAYDRAARRRLRQISEQLQRSSQRLGLSIVDRADFVLVDLSRGARHLVATPLATGRAVSLTMPCSDGTI